LPSKTLFATEPKELIEQVVDGVGKLIGFFQNLPGGFLSYVESLKEFVQAFTILGRRLVCFATVPELVEERQGF